MKYRFVEHKDDSTVGICLEDTGKFDGVIYRYGQVKLGRDENPNGTRDLTFDWILLDSNGVDKEDLMTEEFADIVGSILEELIVTSLETGEYNYDNGDNREDNSITTYLQ